MNCPECKSMRHKVIDTISNSNGRNTDRTKEISKLVKESNLIVRIRECLNCQTRFITEERPTKIYA